MTSYTIALALILAGCNMPTEPADITPDTRTQIICHNAAEGATLLPPSRQCGPDMGPSTAKAWVGMGSCKEEDRYTEPRTVEVCTWVM